MQHQAQVKRRLGVLMTVAGLLVALSAAIAYANVLLRFGPIDGGGVPAYARIEMIDGTPLVHHTDDWAAITFYRDPACPRLSAGFNLLDFFDAPAAFDCPLTVEGFEIWRNGPWTGESGPIETESFGLGAVPIWFVSWEELQGAIGDGILTVTELAALPSLRVGAASYFKETLHPFQSAEQTKTEIVARGTLQDGQSFLYQAEETHNNMKHVKIEFR